MAEGGRGSFSAALSCAEFRAMWAAEALSVVGDQLARVALALVVFDRTSSASLTALTYALTFAPSVLGGFFLSGLADRFPRRAVIVATDVVRGGLAIAMALPGLPLPAMWCLVGVLTLVGARSRAHSSLCFQMFFPRISSRRDSACARSRCRSPRWLVSAWVGFWCRCSEPDPFLRSTAERSC